jgi:hypothetical protein
MTWDHLAPADPADPHAENPAKAGIRRTFEARLCERQVVIATDRRVEEIRHLAIAEAVAIVRAPFAHLLVGRAFRAAVERDAHRPQWPGPWPPRPGAYDGAFPKGAEVTGAEFANVTPRR